MRWRKKKKEGKYWPSAAPTSNGDLYSCKAIKYYCLTNLCSNNRCTRRWYWMFLCQNHRSIGTGTQDLYHVKVGNQWVERHRPVRTRYKKCCWWPGNPILEWKPSLGRKYMVQIDYILCRHCWKSSINAIKTFPVADCGSLHQGKIL